VAHAQPAQVADAHLVAAAEREDDPVEPALRQLGEALAEAELVSSCNVVGCTVSPRKSRRKSPCFSNTVTSTPPRASSSPSTIPADRRR